MSVGPRALVLDVAQDVQSRSRSGTRRCRSTVVCSLTAATYSSGRLGAATDSSVPRLGIEQPDRSRRRRGCSPRARDEQRVERLGDRRAGEDELEHVGLGLRERGRALAVGDVAEVADDAADRRLVAAGWSTSPRSTAAPSPSDTWNSVVTGSSGWSTSDCVQRLALLVDAVGVEVVDEAACRSASSAVGRTMSSTAGLTYCTSPSVVTHDDDVGGVLHEGPEPGLALAEHDPRAGSTRRPAA